MGRKGFRVNLALALLVVAILAACGGGGGGTDPGPQLPLSGDLDMTFGSYGAVTTAVGFGEDYANAMAIQGDGKIVVAGYAYNGTNFDFAVVRYNTDGSLDTSFGTDGKVTTAFGTGTLGNDYAYGVAVQEDGMIVVVGYAYNGTNNDFAVARYNSDGSPDTTFGTSGKVTTAIGTENDLAYAVTIQGDGMILVAGNASNGTNMDFAVVRYTTNGALDTTFNTTGKVTTAIGTGGDFAIGVAVQADGKIVLAGYSSNGTNFDFAVVRYAANGALDTSFGTTGKTTTAIGSGEDFATGMAIQGNGKIVLVGRSINGTLYNWSMARYNTNGSLDATFGTNGNGKVTTNITPSYEIAPGNEGAQGIAIQDDGKIVAAGYYYGGLKSNFALARYNTNGSLDTGFGANGVVTQAIGNTNDGGMAVALDGSSKIVVAGYSSNGVNNDFAVARFWP